MTAEHDALVELALDVDGPAAAVLMDTLLQRGRLSPAIASRCVARAWDVCGGPMSVLPRDRWVALFESSGYTHEFAPAERPRETLRLYRGSDAAGAEGMCWSTNPDVARWLAVTHDVGWVWVADVEPWRLLAFMAETYEDQFVVDTRGLEATVFERPGVVAGLDVDELANRLDERVGARAR